MDIPVRFSKNIGVLTEEEQRHVQGSAVAVVGMGCTGCAVTEFLARAGIGRFILVDGDRFDETNNNRQLYAKFSTLGRFKVEAARDAVLDINPEADITAYTTFLSVENAQEILQPADLVVNGLDDPFTMVVLHRAARALQQTSVFLLSGCLPFQGICTTISPGSIVDYETLMGLPTAGRSLDNPNEIRQELFEKVTKERLLSALRRGAIPGEWVQHRLEGGSVPSFGVTSNITAILAANEAIKVLISRPNLPPVSSPDLIYFDGATCQMSVRTPEPGTFWFQGDF